ncbi:MAG TPA: hypothetical protein PKD39_12450, partial [Chitinophagales bacterium]|nr:hypothetical protein [Chitinophagales bacterium]
MFYPYNLTLHRYKLVFALPEKLTISNYTGSKIRGMIGAALKEYQAPIYQQLYEHALDKPNPMLNAKGDDMPAPYMITPLPYNKGQRTTEVILTLFGHFSDYFSAIVDA